MKTTRLESGDKPMKFQARLARIDLNIRDSNIRGNGNTKNQLRQLYHMFFLCNFKVFDGCYPRNSP